MMATLGRAEEAAAAAGGVAEVVTRIMLVVSRTVLGQAPDVHEQLAALEPRLAELPLVHLAEPVGLLGQIAMTVEEFEISERIADELLDQQRRAGAVGTLPYPLSVRAMLGERRGRWPEALTDAREAVLVAHEVGHLTMHAFTLAVLAHIEADLGDTDSARAHARESAELADRGGATNLGIYSYAALGRAELAVEAADAAAEALDEAARRRRLLAWREPAMVLDGADHVEALLRTGRQDEAAEALDRLAAQAQTAGGTWARAATERARLMMAEGDDVDAHAARALAWHEQAAMPYERARTELAWGERLRRMRLRSQARAPLTRALETFRELGARPWVLRAERELEAAGRPVAAGRARGSRPRRPEHARAADRPDGGPGHDQPRGGGRAVPEPEDDRVPPEPHLPDAGCALTHPAGPFPGPRSAGRHGALTHPVPDAGQQLLLLLAEVVQVAAADAVEMRLTGLGEAGAAGVGDHGVHAAGVAGARAALDQPVADQAVDQARQAAAAEQHGVGQVGHAHLAVGAVGQEQQHLIRAQREAVGGGQLGVELARQRRVGAQEAAPGAELELVELFAAACG